MKKQNDYQLFKKKDQFWQNFYKILKEPAEFDGDVITARELSKIL